MFHNLLNAKNYFISYLLQIETTKPNKPGVGVPTKLTVVANGNGNKANVETTVPVVEVKDEQAPLVQDNTNVNTNTNAPKDTNGVELVPIMDNTENNETRC